MFAKHVRKLESIKPNDAVIIGLAQSLALIPGVSRSGATITFGLFRGFTRRDAARFSFLLSIPAVVLSGVYELKDAFGDSTGASTAALIVATIVGVHRRLLVDRVPAQVARRAHDEDLRAATGSCSARSCSSSPPPARSLSIPAG